MKDKVNYILLLFLLVQCQIAFSQEFRLGSSMQIDMMASIQDPLEFTIDIDNDRAQVIVNRSGFVAFGSNYGMGLQYFTRDHFLRCFGSVGFESYSLALDIRVDEFEYSDELSHNNFYFKLNLDYGLFSNRNAKALYPFIGLRGGLNFFSRSDFLLGFVDPVVNSKWLSDWDDLFFSRALTDIGFYIGTGYNWYGNYLEICIGHDVLNLWDTSPELSKIKLRFNWYFGFYKGLMRKN